MQSSSFCKTVWHGLHILPDGYIRLCSLGTNSDPNLDMQRCRDKDGNLMHILTHSLEEIINSDKHREVRLQNINSPKEWSKHCECCENREKVTQYNKQDPNTSRRVYLMDLIDTESHDYSKISKDGTVDWLPSSLDIRFGNLCNQKCIMCGPHFSNQWYDEYAEYYKTPSFGLIGKIEIVKNPKNNKWIDPPELSWFENPIWWEKFEKLMPGLRHIYVTGGEPMITPAHGEMLDRLIDSGFAKNITLEYDTNLSALNTKIIERWINFKRVKIRISMDATEDQYELIRFGGKWNKFVENINLLQSYIKTNPSISLDAITSCFQILTAFEIMKSEDFCKKMNIPFHIRFLEGPIHLSVNHLPRSMKLELIKYYSKYSNRSLKAQLIIKHLNNYLEKDIDDTAVSEFIRFMDFLDSTRGTSWRTTLPEVHNLLQT